MKKIDPWFFLSKWDQSKGIRLKTCNSFISLNEKNRSLVFFEQMWPEQGDCNSFISSDGLKPDKSFKLTSSQKAQDIICKFWCEEGGGKKRSDSMDMVGQPIDSCVLDWFHYISFRFHSSSTVEPCGFILDSSGFILGGFLPASFLVSKNGFTAHKMCKLWCEERERRNRSDSIDVVGHPIDSCILDWFHSDSILFHSGFILVSFWFHSGFIPILPVSFLASF